MSEFIVARVHHAGNIADRFTKCGVSDTATIIGSRTGIVVKAVSPFVHDHVIDGGHITTVHAFTIARTEEIHRAVFVVGVTVAIKLSCHLNHLIEVSRIATA